MQELNDTFLNFLNHLTVTDVIPVQIPIVFCLLILCWQAYKILRIPEFKFIAFAWIINLIYLICNLFCLWQNFHNIASSILITFLNLLNTFFLLSAVRPRFNYLRNLPNSLIGIIFVLIGLLSVIPYEGDYQFGIKPIQISERIPLVLVQNIPTAIINLIVLFNISLFFKQLIKQFHQTKILYYGTLLYAAIQLLAVFDPDSSFQGIPTFSVLFSFGLIAKLVILLCLSVLLINVGKEYAGQEEIAKKLDNILGITFHEINYPLSAIDNYLKIVAPDDRKINPPHINKYKEISYEIKNSYFHMVAIISASIKMYETDIGKNLELEILPNSIKASTTEAISINTLIEIAILKIKPLFHEQVNFICDFGGNCIITCNSTSIAQVFLNLFKNSWEAFPTRDSEKNHISIKTRIIKSETDNNSNKLVVVEIADNGTGIDESIRNTIFEIGSTTKDSQVKRGFGMAIIKQLVEVNSGAITFESPIYSDADRSGTKFTLTFDHS